MEVCGVHGCLLALKENSRILSKLRELGKGAFKAREALKENGRILSKVEKLGKETFKAPMALKENGSFLSKLGMSPDSEIHREHHARES
jgi:hypothetical protein